MNYPESVAHPRKMLEWIVGSLERFGRYDFRQNGLVRIERWSRARAFDAYRHTLLSLPGKMEGESPSSTMVEGAIVRWNAEQAEVGFRVRQDHVGRVRPKMRDAVSAWVKAGKPFPSSGGFYYTIPNKSYSRVKELSEYPELRDAVINLGIQDEWVSFFETYLPYRHDISRHLLETLVRKVDPAALSRDNEEAGTGLSIRGRRLKRKDLGDYAEDLRFLLPYSYAMGLAFAATQIAELSHDSVWVIDCYDHRIKGAVASRSDMDITDVGWDGERLTISGLAQTRQAGSDSTGVLTNSVSEKRLIGSSVTEYVLRKRKREGVEYPFTDRDTLLKVWATDAKPFPNREYVIGQDFGLSEPVKSPADALFSRGFMKLGTKVVPLMLSGSSWTQAVYSVFHNYFIDKAAVGDKFMALGDDMTLLTMSTKPEIFMPYQKVKSTDPAMNTKKILGLYSAFSQEEDPEGKQQAILAVVPRVLKSISSASKRGSYWGEQLSNLAPSGSMELSPSPEVSETIEADLDVIAPYLFWKGERRDLKPMLEARWKHVNAAAWAVLVKHDPEIVFKLQREESLEDNED